MPETNPARGEANATTEVVGPRPWTVADSKGSLKMTLLRHASSWFTYRRGETNKDPLVATRRVHRILTAKSKLVLYASEYSSTILQSKSQRDNYLWCWPAGYRINKVAQKYPCRLVQLCPWCWARRAIPTALKAAQSGDEHTLLVSRRYMINVPHARYLSPEHSYVKAQETARLRSLDAEGWVVAARAEPHPVRGFRLLVSSLALIPTVASDRVIDPETQRPALWNYLRSLKMGSKFRTQATFLPLRQQTLYENLSPFWKFPRLILGPDREVQALEIAHALKGQHLLSLGGTCAILRKKT